MQSQLDSITYLNQELGSSFEIQAYQSESMMEEEPVAINDKEIKIKKEQIKLETTPGGQQSQMLFREDDYSSNQIIKIIKNQTSNPIIRNDQQLRQMAQKYRKFLIRLNKQSPIEEAEELDCFQELEKLFLKPNEQKTIYEFFQQYPLTPSLTIRSKKIISFVWEIMSDYHFQSRLKMIKAFNKFIHHLNSKGMKLQSINEKSFQRQDKIRFSKQTDQNHSRYDQSKQEQEQIDKLIDSKEKKKLKAEERELNKLREVISYQKGIIETLNNTISQRDSMMRILVEALEKKKST